MLLTTLYTDVKRDPTRGDWGDTMMAISVETHNAAANIPTTKLRLLTTSSSSTSDNYTGCVIVSGGVWQIYTAITHWMNKLAHRDQSIYDKLFAMNNELINDW